VDQARQHADVLDLGNEVLLKEEAPELDEMPEVLDLVEAIGV
jgi:hypothetical protein